MLQEGVKLLSYPAKVGRGTGCGYDFIQGLPYAMYYCGHTSCAAWAHKLMVINTGPYM